MGEGGRKEEKAWDGGGGGKREEKEGGRGGGKGEGGGEGGGERGEGRRRVGEERVVSGKCTSMNLLYNHAHHYLPHNFSYSRYQTQGVPTVPSQHHLIFLTKEEQNRLG